MASVKQFAGKKKSNDEKQTNTQGSLSNQEKKDLAKKIKNLEDENKRLSLENVIHKEKFDLREILNVLSQKGVTELDGIEIAKDLVKNALQEADEKHSAEKKCLERKHEKEIEKISQKLQGADQQQTQSKAVYKEKYHANYISELESGASKHSQETDEEIAKYRAQNKELERVAGKKKTSDETPNKTQGSLSNKEKKDLAQKIQNLQDENQRLRLENVMFKNNFDLREIIKVLSHKGVTELDGIEIAKDIVKTALREADEKHSAEKKDLERKHEKEIEKISQKLQGADQQQTQSKAVYKEKYHANYITELESGDSKHSQETDEEIAKYRAKNKELEREVVSLKADKEKLNNNIKQLKTEKESLMNRLTTTDELLSKKDNEITDLKKQLANLTTRNQDTIPKAVNLDDMHVLLRETTKEIDDANSEKKALLAEKQKLEAEIQKLKNENKEQKNSYEKTKEKVKGALLADKQRMDANIKRLQDEIKPLKQSEDKNKSLNEKLKKVEEAKDNLNQQVQALQKENNELKYRFRELKSTQPTINNPSIAELSDAFRPKKLSERYSQLYDNMWTDAFEEHNGKKEEDIIQMLRKRLLGSYEYCENVCREFTVQLTNSALALPNSKPNNRDIPIGYKKQLQEIKKNFGVFLRNDVKESYRKQNAIEGGDKTKNYIDACVELCWLMVIQDPPVVLETPAPKDSTFDTNTYMTYTMTGTKVDFVVWPALRLHHGGPLLSKGVAQGKK